MTFGSLLLCLFIFYIIVRKGSIISKYKNLLLMDICIEMLFPRGYFLKIGTSEVTYNLFMSCFMIIASWYVFIKGKVKIPKNIFFYGISFLIVALIGVIYQELSPIEGLIMGHNSGGWDDYSLGIPNKVPVDISWMRVASLYVTLINMVFVVFIFKSVICYSEILEMLKKINYILRINLFSVAIEFFLKNIMSLNIISDILKFVLGDGTSTYTNLIVRNGLYQLQGVTREPSHLAVTLFFTVVLYIQERRLLSNKKITIKDYAYIGICVLMSYFSGSFASFLYIGVAIIWFIYLYSLTKGKFYKIAVVSLSIITSLTVLYFVFFQGIDSSSYLGGRINLASTMLSAVVTNDWYGMGGDSALPRFLSIFETLNDFFKRPVFGLGISVEQSYGGLVNMLADIGVIGVLNWFIFVLSRYRYDNKSLFILLILSNLLVSISFNCLGSTSIVFIIACFRVVDANCLKKPI